MNLLYRTRITQYIVENCANRRGHKRICEVGTAYAMLAECWDAVPSVVIAHAFNQTNVIQKQELDLSIVEQSMKESISLLEQSSHQ